MSDKLRDVARIAVTLIVVAAVALVAVLAVPGAIGAEDSYVVLSGSMEPEIRSGDVVVVRSTPTRAIDVGDIVTYRAERDVGGEGTNRVTHRVVERRRTDGGVVFRTKGDANEAADPEPVEPAQIVGTVWFHVPYVGLIVHFAQQPVGHALLVVLPGLLLVGSGLRTLYSEGAVE
ncbi:signal peptidase I [Haloplanus sp. GCM10025708]|uniref:signal peptidase I n=1 Tax=Haloferacaceae TaxID=1644056 RepID=UPI00360F868F